MHSRQSHTKSRFWQRWFVTNLFVSGILALVWLVLRSGTKPSRFTYPCQQAAISTATLAFGGPVVATILTSRNYILRWMRSPRIVTAALAGFALSLFAWGFFLQAKEYSGPILAPASEYRAQVFHVENCPPDPAGDRFVGVDNLITQMGQGGLYFYDSSNLSPVAAPDGIIARDDVVLVKINYQWDQRGGTNMDLLRGLLSKITDHPDGFVGEIIICENAQFASTSNFDRSQNNAQDRTLSPHDIVVHFQGLGFDISHFDWTTIRHDAVAEFDEGDMNDGYIVYPHDSGINGKVSYPKFQSDAGTYISLRDGIWDPTSESYDKTGIKFLNLPVLKSHHSTYGATVAVKHYMGLVTRELSTNSHGAIRYGLLGATIGEIGLADLNIVDAIWINANPNSGPGTSYSGATRRDELVASVDPIAIDMWAVKNVLIPGFLDNGYSPPWPYPSSDPDDPNSAFRLYMDTSMYQILNAGYQVTNDYAQIDLRSGPGDGGDFDRDGDVDFADYDTFDACFTGDGGGPVDSGCELADLDLDGDVDCNDWVLFQFLWTELTGPPELGDCEPASVDDDPLDSGAPDGRDALDTKILHIEAIVPNPTSSSAEISFSLERDQHVCLELFDTTGRSIRLLADEICARGSHTVSWDGRNSNAEPVGSGVYFLRAVSGGETSAAKVIVQ